MSESALIRIARRNRSAQRDHGARDGAGLHDPRQQQADAATAREGRARRREHEPRHQVGMPAPDELRDGTAHRVADEDRVRDPLLAQSAATSSAQSESRKRQLRMPRAWPRRSGAITR
jgi:hypothetical protein